MPKKFSPATEPKWAVTWDAELSKLLILGWGKRGELVSNMTGAWVGISYIGGLCEGSSYTDALLKSSFCDPMY